MKKSIIKLAVVALILSSPLAHASVESSLMGLKNVLLGSILPIFSVLGLGFVPNFLDRDPPNFQIAEPQHFLIREPPDFLNAEPR